ncbi:MAG: 30S ribosomal protein S6 [Planctomycetota bacterium]|nr:30S ribosomal protein S6 [Planctomycetota bacterium]
MSAVAENPVRQHFYEGMFLVDSGKFATDPEGVTGEIMTVLAKAGATVVAHRPWQDGKLAYEIQGMKKGLHYIVCFTMRGAGMKTLIRQCQLNETIIRQMIIAHSQQIFEATVASLTGATPSPQEGDAPRGERSERGRPDRHTDEELPDLDDE